MNNQKMLISIFLLFAILQNGYAALSDFELIKKRVLKTLLESPVNDAQIETLVNAIKVDGTWPGINYEDVSNEGFQHSRHSAYLVDLARAYQSKSSKFHKNKKVKNTIELALKNWVDNDYICHNWWHNQIGTPNNLVHLMLLVGDELPNELVEKAQPIIGRAHTDAPGSRPGGDRIKIAGIQSKNLLFLGKKETFDKVVRIIEGEIKFSEWVGAEYGYGFRHIPSGFANREMGGRGIQYDYSFHHRVDGVNNTLSYGTSYADAFAEWVAYTTGTEYAFSEEKINKLVDYYLDGICKHLIFGKFPDPGAKNRSISRKGTLHPVGSSIISKLLTSTNYRINELEEIRNTRDNDAKSTLSHATYFWHSEHFTFQRPNWFASVRMYSSRTHNMEQPYNSEGLFNHHRGDGTNHISCTGDEYFDIAPVFDYQKVPGATIMQKPELPAPNQIQKLGTMDFVGAATDGKFAAVAFDFKSPHDPLVARKSWFFFDNEYVCLGAGISCKTQLPVVTAINQCLLRGDVTLSTGKNKLVVDKGEKEFQNVNWVFHDGIGYVFPEPAKVGLKNNAETGSWWEINKQSDSPKEEISLDVFKLWLDHGNRPSGESYGYIVVPATTVGELEKISSKNNVETLLNTPEIQAVKHSGLNMCQAVFYKGGTLKVSNDLQLVCDNPGIVILKMNGGKVTEISVADPNRELGKFHLSISIKMEKSGDDFTAKWNEKTGLTKISVDLPKTDYAGKSVTVKL